jgi:hypothetical protein
MNAVNLKCLCLTMMLGVPVAANAVITMPKEGKFDFNFCFVTDVQHIALDDKTYVGHFVNGAAIHSNPSAGPFDLQGARCFGYYGNVTGEYGDQGYCEAVDTDGDRWLMNFQSRADQSGTWKAVAGTGKYAGMIANGTYKPVGFVASPVQGRNQRCNRNTGTYQLK